MPCVVAKIYPNKFMLWCQDGDFLAIVCVLYFQRAACSTFSDMHIGHQRRNRTSHSCTKLLSVKLASECEICHGNDEFQSCLWPLSWCNSWSSHQDSEEWVPASSDEDLVMRWNIKIRYKCLVVIYELLVVSIYQPNEIICWEVMTTLFCVIGLLCLSWESVNCSPCSLWLWCQSPRSMRTRVTYVHNTTYGFVFYCAGSGCE